MGEMNVGNISHGPGTEPGSYAWHTGNHSATEAVCQSYLSVCFCHIAAARPETVNKYHVPVISPALYFYIAENTVMNLNFSYY